MCHFWYYTHSKIKLLFCRMSVLKQEECPQKFHFENQVLFHTSKESGVISIE